jgi:hypothetical protein
MANIYQTNASSAYANLCLVNSDGSYEPLSNNLINGKSIIKCFLNYNDDKMQLIPSEHIDVEYLDKAIDLCANKKFRLLLKEDPPFPKGPTVGINTCTVTIDSDGVWKAKHMIVEIDVPENKEFDIDVKRYKISLKEGKLNILWR